MNEYAAYLRIRHPSIDPGEITRTLFIPQAHAWAAGSVRPSAGEAAPRRVHPQTCWLAPPSLLRSLADIHLTLSMELADEADARH